MEKEGTYTKKRRGFNVKNLRKTFLMTLKITGFISIKLI